MKRTILAGALFTALALAPATSALAQDARPARSAEPSAARMDEARTRGLAAIDKRLDTLRKLTDKVTAAEYLSDSHRSSLLEIYASQQSGLSTLRSKIESDTDSETLKADVKSIVTDYRVYLVTVPKTNLVMASDRLLAAADKLDNIAAKLQTAIDREKAEGKDTSSAESSLAGMKSHTASARTGASGVPDRVVPLRPQDYPGNTGELDSARDTLRAARGDVVAARDAAKACRDALR